jgi:hypothetical protein
MRPRCLARHPMPECGWRRRSENAKPQGPCRPHWPIVRSLFIALLDFTRFRRHISTSSSKLLECQRAQLGYMTVLVDSIVKTSM